MRVKNSRAFLALLLLAMPSLFFTGCSEKLDAEAQRVMALAAHTSKERAATIRAMSSEIKAVAAADAPHVAKYLNAHAEGLAAEAKGLADFVQASTKGKLHKHSIEQIIAAGETAVARAKGWAQMSKKIHAPNIPPETFAAFVATHQEGLDKTAEALNALGKKLEKQLE